MVIGGTLDADLADGSTITNTATVTSSATDLNPAGRPGRRDHRRRAGQ